MEQPEIVLCEDCEAIIDQPHTTKDCIKHLRLLISKDRLKIMRLMGLMEKLED